MSAKLGTVDRLGIFPTNLLNTHMPGLDTSPAGLVKTSSTTAVTDGNTAVSAVYTKFEMTAALGIKTVDDREPASFGHTGPVNAFYFHPDHLGSSSYITNKDRKAVQHMEYLPLVRRW